LTAGDRSKPPEKERDWPATGTHRSIAAGQEQRFSRHRVELPGLLDPLQLVLASVGEPELAADDEVANGARDNDLARLLDLDHGSKRTPCAPSRLARGDPHRRPGAGLGEKALGHRSTGRPSQTPGPGSGENGTPAPHVSAPIPVPLEPPEEERAWPRRALIVCADVWVGGLPTSWPGLSSPSRRSSSSSASRQACAWWRCSCHSASRRPPRGPRRASSAPGAGCRARP
jgi:hypothetical protein